METEDLRGNIYGLLAQGLREPPDGEVLRERDVRSYRDLRRALFEAVDTLMRLTVPIGAEVDRDAADRLMIAVRQIPEPPGTLDQLRPDYLDAFQNPLADRVIPVESVYRPWSEDPSTPTALAGSRGYLMSDRAGHVRELYRLAGFTVPAGFEATPDHVSLELDFMASLCRLGNAADQANFLLDHLDWLEELASD